LTLPTLSIDPHGQQRAVVQGKVSFACGHTLPSVAAGSTEAATGLYHRLTQNTSTEADWHAYACAYNMRKGEGRMESAKLRSIACLTGGPQLLLHGVLGQALCYDASIKSADGLIH